MCIVSDIASLSIKNADRDHQVVSRWFKHLPGWMDRACHAESVISHLLSINDLRAGAVFNMTDARVQTLPQILVKR
jgi:hypothetical protein